MAQGQTREYSDAWTLKLLDCGDSCVDRQKPGRKGRFGGVKEERGLELGMGLKETGPAKARVKEDPSGGKSTINKKKLIKEEREQAAQRREAQKRRRMLYLKVRRVFMRFLPIIVGVILGMIAFRMMDAGK